MAFVAVAAEIVVGTVVVEVGTAAAVVGTVAEFAVVVEVAEQTTYADSFSESPAVFSADFELIVQTLKLVAG